MEVLVVVATAIILFLTFCFLAALSGAKSYARQAGCESILKSLGIGFRTWESDHNDLYPMRYFTNQNSTLNFGFLTDAYRSFQVMSNELSNPRILICPADNRKPAADFAHLNNNNLSYFVDLDADEARPALWLAGDRNLITNGTFVVPGLAAIKTNDVVGWSERMHKNRGNVLMSDGSVVVQRSPIIAGTNVNRLAVP